MAKFLVFLFFAEDLNIVDMTSLNYLQEIYISSIIKSQQIGGYSNNINYKNFMSVEGMKQVCYNLRGAKK